ncbi:MAG: tetratricopeptide repeat protein [Candidatus Accumulibacter sp.]|jgi:predicted O-linked N-acetylglucosamine transferase (SPINDLY family)|nr:tetratricopeptide repeat protein [Accumulibacter sp.]
MGIDGVDPLRRDKISRAQALFGEGLARSRAGRFAEAREYYERGLKLFPGQPDAVFLLGETHFELGNAAEGERLVRRAIAANPRADNYRRAFATRLFKAGRLDEARAFFEDAARLNPSEPANLSGLASVLEGVGRFADAIAVWLRLLERAPASLEALARLSRLFVAENRVPEAFAMIERWMNVASNASDASAYALRAELYESVGNATAALADYADAAARAPDDASTHAKYALALAKAGDDDAALAHFDASVRLEPRNALLHFNRGVAYARAGVRDQAVSAYETALGLLTLSTDLPLASNTMLNLANLYSDLDRCDEARALYTRILAAEPKNAAALFNLGMLDLAAGHKKDAVKTLERALAADPDGESAGLVAAHLLFQKMHLCEWDGLEDLTRRVIHAVENDTADVPPFITLSIPGTTPCLQRRCAANHSARLKKPGMSVFSETRRCAAPRERLRVGYLSSYFKAHAMPWLTVETLEAHDRARFEIFALSYGVDDASPMRTRVVNAVEHFVELAGLPDRDAVARIAALELDAIVDWNGYTEGNCSRWLQYRLAPRQISWIGYPGTLDAPWVEFLIADVHVAPPENDSLFSERVVRLPGCYLPNCRARECAPVPTRAEEGLPEGALVLCSFNQTVKITPEMFALWIGLLGEFPETVLWLWASNRWAEASLRRVAEAAGLVPSRVVFAESRPQAEHLARLPLADLALDTFPCNGHTTSSDALWAGVPVVTLEGEAFASRVAGSLLHAAGLPELVAPDTAAYRAIVRRFCRDQGFRDGVSNKARALRETSDLFDSAKFARKLEACFEEICLGEG